MNSLYEHAKRSKNPKRLFWSWYLGGILFFSIILTLPLLEAVIKTGNWDVFWTLLIVPIVVLFACFEKFQVAYLIKDETKI